MENVWGVRQGAQEPAGHLGLGVGSHPLEVVLILEGRDLRRRQGFGRRTEGPVCLPESIWGPVANLMGICALTPGRVGPQSKMQFSTKLSRCLLCWFALFIYLF